MAERIETQLIVEAITKGFDQVRRDQEKLGRETEKTGKAAADARQGFDRLGTNVQRFATIAVGAIATVVALGVSIKKAFDLGRAGAAIDQTRQSWEIFLDGLGIGSGLLDELRIASRDTISDMDLMAATMTLAAGAEDDLAEALINATPQLLEIAKASNKLNPSLGDTAFLYNSLATGVKRASPLILDNLGLTIRVGEANERYAEQLGVTVAELSTTDQKMALLNETIRAGRILMAQAGNTTEAATDAYDQFAAGLANSADRGKRFIDSVLRPIVTRFNESTKGARALKDALDKQIISWDEFVALNQELRSGLFDTEQLLTFLAAIERDAADSATEMADRHALVNEEFGRTAGAADDAAQAVLRVSGAHQDLFDGVNTGLQGMISKWQETIDFITSGGPELQAAAEKIVNAFRAGDITAEQATGALQEIMAGELARQVEEGDLSVSDAATTLSEEYNLAWSDALTLIEDARTRIDQIPRNIMIDLEFMRGKIPDMQIPGTFIPNQETLTIPGTLQRGGQFVVPGMGSAHRPVVMNAQPGEGVAVTPTSEMNDNRSILRGGTVNIHNRIDEETFDDAAREWFGAGA